jgi:hypothetical protein
MGTAGEPEEQMDERALLTEREREVLLGDADDVENLARYQSKVRTRLRARIEALEEDLTIIEDTEPEIADELHQQVCGDHESRLTRLEHEVENLREEITD